MKRIAVVIGTRPEAIKMAPVVRALRAAPDMTPLVWSSGQHREMLDQALGLFDIGVDRELGVMTPGQTLSDAYAAVLAGVARLIREDRPDWILVHGDTSTAAAAATAAFHARVPIGHVEAGLRSGRLDQPWPEEFNRRLVDMVSDRLFAPTEAAQDNLRAENIPPHRIAITGNTVVDALIEVRDRLETSPERAAAIDARLPTLDPQRPLVLVTGHRRENFGIGFQGICEALARLDDLGVAEIVYPVHLNPQVREPVQSVLTGRRRLHLIEPVDYETFVRLMSRAAVILTDSGGVQEEAPTFGTPVLVMRDVTERPEAVEIGASRLVGASPDAIVEGVMSVLEAEPRAPVANPYGDGQAARRIVEGLRLASDPVR